MAKNIHNLDDWIAASYALDLTKDAFGTKKGIDLLKTALCEGRVLARAKVSLSEVDFGKIAKRAPQSKSQRTYSLQAPLTGNIIIEAEFWKITEKSMFEPILWQWENNIFAYVVPSPCIIIYDPRHDRPLVVPAMRTVMYGVEIQGSSLSIMIDADMTDVDRRRQSTLTITERRNRKLITEYDWERLLFDLYEKAKRGLLEESFGAFTKRGSQAKLEREISNRFDANYGDQPADSTCRRMAVKLRELNSRSLSNQDGPT